MVKVSSTAISVPLLNAMPGARWVEFTNGRLKVVLNTGGCKTASCRFCSLPRFGRQAVNTDPVSTVRRALEEHRPRALAVYNDGSLLNPAEVATPDLWRLCDEIRTHGILSLWIESIPRFVLADIVIEVKRRAGVSRLVVGMGFQCAGDHVAQGVLGRPDPDSRFEDAVNCLHESGAQARFYLLWGFPLPSGVSWVELLRNSLQWAVDHKVDTVTICPFVTSRESDHGEQPLCQLRACLEFWSSLRRAETEIEVSLSDRVSCAVGSTPSACHACLRALKEGRWDSQELLCNMATVAH